MANYVILFRLTQRGVTDIKQSPARIEAAKEMATRMGGKVIGFYALMGAYDTVFILDAPDDKAAAKIALAIGSQGNVSTETMRAFTEDEFRAMVAALP
jgi:uncharacterized protein with GYD domain